MKKCLSIIISIVMIMSMLSCPVSVGAADGEDTPVTLIDENFDNYDITKGTDILDTRIHTSSKWVEKQTKIHRTKKELLHTTGIDDSATQVLNVYIDSEAGSAQSNSNFYRPIDSSVSNTAGVYILKFDMKMNSLKSGNGIQIALNEADDGSSTDGQIYLANTYKDGGISFNDKNTTTTTEKSSEWKTWEIIYNSLTKTIGLKIGGDTKIPFYTMANVNSKDNTITLVDTVGSVAFILTRNNDNDDSIYLDNIKLTNQSAAAYDAANTLPETITYNGENLALPTTGLTGSTITWTSSHPDVVSTTGVVTLPTDEAKTVRLTATVSDGTSVNATKTYDVAIPKGVSNEAYAQQAANAIVVPDYYGQEILELPFYGRDNTDYTIEWTCENTDVIPEIDTYKTATSKDSWAKAYINMPDETTTVTLNAAVTYKDATVNKTFTYVIYGKDTPLEEDFALNGYSGDINGYNGWTVTNDASESKPLDTSGLIENGQLIFKQGIETNPANYEVSKSFRPIVGGVATLALDADFADSNITNTGGGFYVEIAGMQLQLRPRRLYGISEPYKEITVPSDKKYSIKVRINIDALTADVAINNEYIGSCALSDCNGIVENVVIYPLRVQGKSDATVGTEFTLDNIKVTREIPAIQLANIGFTDANGNAVIGRTEGGKVKEVTLSANKDLDSVCVIAAVYNGDTLYSTAIGTAANLTKDVTETITFANPATLPSADAVVKVFALDSAAKLIPLNYAPLSYSKTGDTVQFFMCGDSIMCNYGSSTNTVGVGMRIGNFFDADKVSVTNLAKSGSSTKTFYEEKYELQNNLGSIKNGDYVFLMFGHNDSSAAAKGTDETYYKLYLTKMINMVRTKGAIPVLMSPVVRYTPYEDNEATTDVDESKTLNNESLARYTDYMENLASELNVKYIDVNAMTLNLIQNEYGVGSDEADEFYILKKNNGAAHDEIEEGSSDTTHLTDTGAIKVAKLIADYMKTNNWLPAGYFAE